MRRHTAVLADNRSTRRLPRAAVVRSIQRGSSADHGGHSIYPDGPGESELRLGTKVCSVTRGRIQTRPGVARCRGGHGGLLVHRTPRLARGDVDLRSGPGDRRRCRRSPNLLQRLRHVEAFRIVQANRNQLDAFARSDNTGGITDVDLMLGCPRQCDWSASRRLSLDVRRSRSGLDTGAMYSLKRAPMSPYPPTVRISPSPCIPASLVSEPFRLTS